MTNPTYTVDDVVHYGVTNMPAAVPKTSTFALTNATIPYVISLADLGTKRRGNERPLDCSGNQYLQRNGGSPQRRDRPRSPLSSI